MGTKRAGGARKKKSESSRSTLWAVVGVLLFFVLAAFELVPLLLQALAAALDLDGDLASRWPLAPDYWILVIVFAGPLVAATTLALRLGGLTRAKGPLTRAGYWSAVGLGLGFCYSLAVQWAMLGGRHRPLVTSQLSDRLDDLPLTSVDVLRAAAYPNLFVILATFAALVILAQWTREDRPRVYAWIYLAIATVAVLVVASVNGTRYF